MVIIYVERYAGILGSMQVLTVNRENERKIVNHEEWWTWWIL